ETSDAMLQRCTQTCSGKIQLVVTVSTVALVFALSVAYRRKATTGPSREACYTNLRQIGGAFEEFSLDHGRTFPMGVSTNMGGTAEFTGSGGETYRHFRPLSNVLESPCYSR